MSSVTRSRCHNFARKLAPVVFALALWPVVGATTGADGATVPRSVIITGSVEECGAGPNDFVVRPLVIKLHVRPSDRTVAVYIVEPGSYRGSYAFSVLPGRYALTTNSVTSLPPRGTIVIRRSSKSIFEVPIATICQ